MQKRPLELCNGILHPRAAEGIQLFNVGDFFEAHEELETAWREESGEIRDLYRGILQVAVTYLHITRRNYDGALKVYGRSQKWLAGWGKICRGVNVYKLLCDAEETIKVVERLGRDGLATFNASLLQPIQWNKKRLWLCDRCGSEMHENNCKITCTVCGNRFDCSDLNLYFD